ncbi:hypothetical protein G4B11_005315, partial [Aspergillus flavus]
ASNRAIGAQVVSPGSRSSSATNQPALLTIRPTTGRSGFKLTSNLQTPSALNVLTSLLRRYNPNSPGQCSSNAQPSPSRGALPSGPLLPALSPPPSSAVPNKAKYAVEKDGKILSFEEIKTEEDLVPPGAKAGTVPSDIEQATGLERLELVGKMQGIDIFDMRPLDASRKGTLENPIIVNGAGDEQYAGCTGFPADSHTVNWLTVSRDRPIERCGECGNVVKLNYVGPLEDAHDHDHGHGHGHPAPEEPKTFADYVKPEYWYR